VGNEQKKLKVCTVASVSCHICTLEVCLELRQNNFLADIYLYDYSMKLPSKLKNRLPSLKKSMLVCSSLGLKKCISPINSCLLTQKEKRKIQKFYSRQLHRQNQENHVGVVVP
jgi:hypothetical protein